MLVGLLILFCSGSVTIGTLLFIFKVIKPLLLWLNQKITGKRIFSDTFIISINLILTIITIIVSILIFGQIAIMISGEPGNVISNSHFFESEPPVNKEEQKVLEAKKELRQSENSKIVTSLYLMKYNNIETYYHCQAAITDTGYDAYHPFCNVVKNYCTAIEHISEYDVKSEDINMIKDNKDMCDGLGWYCKCDKNP